MIPGVLVLLGTLGVASEPIACPSVLRIVSLKRGDIVHSTCAFDQGLVRLATEDGHHSIVYFRGLRLTALEPLVCDYLLPQGLIIKKGLPCRQLAAPVASIEVEANLF